MCNCASIQFERNANEIIPNLWLGNVKSAYNRHFLKHHNIKHIVSVMDNFNSNYYCDDISYLFIPITDKDVCAVDMTNMFNLAIKFILNGLQKNEGVLVHCKNGHNRSAVIVAAFLFRYLKISYSDILAYIHRIRHYALRRNTCMLSKLVEYCLVSKRIM